MSGAGELEAMIGKIRRMPKALLSEAPALAELVRAEIVKAAAAGRAPGGDAWAPKKDGGMALRNVAGSITARAAGALIEGLSSMCKSYHSGLSHIY